MRNDERAVERRPRGAVLRPMGLLLAAVATGFGMWRVLMHDEPVAGPVGEQISQHDRQLLDTVLTDHAR